MNKSIEATGRTEEAAIQAALEQLGLKREQVSVEVIALSRAGFLGLGSSPARIKVTYEAPGETTVSSASEPEVDTPPKTGPVNSEETPLPGTVGNGQEAVLSATTVEATKEETPVEVKQEDALTEHRIAKIYCFLTGLMEHMELQATPEIHVDREGNYLVELVGTGLGRTIGHQGETLDAIQQITNCVVNKGESERIRVRIDAEGYRAKREEALSHMARKTAERVVKYRKNITLEPMNAYERHVIHTALQDYPNISTRSIGSEPDRRTVIAYTPGEKRHDPSKPKKN